MALHKVKATRGGGVSTVLKPDRAIAAKYAGAVNAVHRSLSKVPALTLEGHPVTRIKYPEGAPRIRLSGPARLAIASRHVLTRGSLEGRDRPTGRALSSILERHDDPKAAFAEIRREWNPRGARLSATGGRSKKPGELGSFDSHAVLDKSGRFAPAGRGPPEPVLGAMVSHLLTLADRAPTGRRESARRNVIDMLAKHVDPRTGKIDHYGAVQSLKAAWTGGR